jgi:hypothetical protein
MTNYIKRCFYCLFIVLLLACFAFDNPQQEAIILFEDDFQDGEPDNWDITAAWYIQQSGDEYIFEGNGAGGAWVPEGGGWSDYAFRCSVQMETGPLLLSFNLSEEGRYMVRADEYGVYLVKENPAKEFNVIAQTGPLPDDSWHYLAMGSYEGQVQVYVDQELWIDYTDTEPLSGGTIAVSSLDDSRVAVDNVLVTQLMKPLPSGEIKAPPAMQASPPDMEMGEDNGLALDQVDDITDQGGEPQGGQSGQADLVIRETSFDPDPVISGQPFSANYVIANDGDAPTGAFTLLWKFHAATGIGVCSWDYLSLAPGEVVWGGCQKLTNAQPGQSPTTLTVDFEGEIAESNEENNIASPTLNVTGLISIEAVAAFPDLLIGAMAYGQGNFRCDLVNYGDASAPAGVRVALYVNGSKIGWQETSEPLPSGGSVRFYLPIEMEIDEINRGRCVADGPNAVVEENEENNEFFFVSE